MAQRRICSITFVFLVLVSAFLAASPPAQAQGLSLRLQQQTPTVVAPAKRSITLSDAVSIFLQQNLQLVAARYDVDTADAEKLTRRLRSNPPVTIRSSG